MSFIDMLNVKTGVSVGAAIVVILMTLIQIAPITAPKTMPPMPRAKDINIGERI